MDETIINDCKNKTKDKAFEYVNSDYDNKRFSNNFEVFLMYICDPENEDMKNYIVSELSINIYRGFESLLNFAISCLDRDDKYFKKCIHDILDIESFSDIHNKIKKLEENFNRLRELGNYETRFRKRICDRKELSL